MSSTQFRPRRLAYLSLQAVAQGQDSWAAVLEVIEGMRAEGWTVDEWFPSYPSGGAPGAVGRLREMLRLQAALIRRLDEYDAVYVRGHPFARRLARAAKKRGVPVIQECNGSYEDLFIAWPAARPGRRWIEGWQREQFRDASAVIAVTPELARWVIAETGRAEVTVSPNAANTDVFRPDAPRREGLPARYAVFFGQFAPWQGLDVLLDATRTNAWPDDVALVVAGDGVLRTAVEAAQQDGRVVYVGKLPYDAVAGVIADAVASFVPMHDAERATTGLSPLKLFESMACGVPVIASDTPGISEVIEGCGCGLLVPAGDADALARALGQIVASPEAAREMGVQARDTAVREHSWRARAAQRMQVVEREIVASEGRLSGQS